MNRVGYSIRAALVIFAIGGQGAERFLESFGINLDVLSQGSTQANNP